MKEVQEFLNHFSNTWFTAIHDKNGNVMLDKKATTGIGEELLKLNQEGCGIFFTPNAMGDSRSDKDCTGINAWFVEADNCSKEDQYEKLCSAPLLPSLMVATRKSIHAYWLAEDGTLENFKQIQKCLIDFFDGDKSIKNPSRLLRVPEFFHHKQEPFKCEWIYPRREKAKKYTEADMFRAYGSTIKIETKGNILERVSRIDCKKALENLSGTDLVNNETYSFRSRTSGGEYIDINGEPADCWLDEKGLIGSGKGACPTVVQWLRFYGLSNKSIIQWAEKSKLLPATLETKVAFNPSDSYLNEIENIMNQESIFTWGTVGLDDKFSPFMKGHYIVLAGETNVGKTTYSTFMAIQNARKGSKVGYITLEMAASRVLTNYARNKLKISLKDWKLKNYDKSKVLEVVKEVSSNLKWFDNPENIPTTELIKQILSKVDLDLVFIDNLGYLDGEGSNENEKVKKISRDLKVIATQTDTAIICLHHFRKKQGSGNGIRNLDEMMGSGKIGHDVDYGVQVYRDPDIIENEDASPMDKASLTVVISKDRDWGLKGLQNVYYKQGEFYDEFEKTYSTAEAFNKINNLFN